VNVVGSTAVLIADTRTAERHTLHHDGKDSHG
jgi:hypothetical protein